MARRFVIGEPLGRGGFGTIYRADYFGDGDFRKAVALKLLNAELTGQSEVVGRLRDEARMLGLLRHRAIVGVDRLTQVGDRWAVVMEYVDGVDLAAVVHHGPCPPAASFEIASEVASALHAAWTTVHPDGYPIQLLHRDIKPANVQVTAHGEVKVLDFGIARAVFHGREAMTVDGIPGTLQYMAPERMAGEDGPETDVYSLGALLFELLAGARLGRGWPMPDRHAALLTTAQTRLRNIGLPERATALVLSMLAFEPGDRPSAEQTVELTSQMAAGLQGPRLRTWASRTIPAIMQARQRLPADELHGRELLEVQTTPTLANPPRRERPLMWGLAVGISALVVLCAGGGLIAWLWSRPPAAVVAPAEPATVERAPVEPAPAAAAPTETTATPEVTTPPPTAPKEAPPPSTSRARSTSRSSQTPAPPEATPPPAPRCVTTKYLAQGGSSASIALVDAQNGKALRNGAACVPGGRTYNVQLDCPGAGLITLQTGTAIPADAASAVVQCFDATCSCTIEVTQ